MFKGVDDLHFIVSGVQFSRDSDIIILFFDVIPFRVEVRIIDTGVVGDLPVSLIVSDGINIRKVWAQFNLVSMHVSL